MPEERTALVERLYACFNSRDAGCLAELCDEGMEFFPQATAEAIGRGAPYAGPAGVRQYLDDVAQVWEELQITPGELELRGETVLVRGRVYARSREQGIRDLPVAWLWEVRDGRFVRGEVFPDPEQAEIRFSAVA
ncbi:MAG TPA: nuclear transport factor 2 family protein [Solirubrobacterales bacterium]|nr:nuclear transport factor 2 family protein [Solirubrobacterales bacterium]